MALYQIDTPVGLLEIDHEGDPAELEGAVNEWVTSRSTPAAKAQPDPAPVTQALVPEPASSGFADAMDVMPMEGGLSPFMQRATAKARDEQLGENPTLSQVAKAVALTPAFPIPSIPQQPTSSTPTPTREISAEDSAAMDAFAVAQGLPLPSIARAQATSNAPAQVAAGVANTVVGAANFMATPVGGAMSVIGEAPVIVQKLVSTGFGVDMIHENAPRVLTEPTLQRKVEAGLGTAMGATALVHGAGRVMPEPIVTPEARQKAAAELDAMVAEARKAQAEPPVVTAARDAGLEHTAAAMNGEPVTTVPDPVAPLSQEALATTVSAQQPTSGKSYSTPEAEVWFKERDRLRADYEATSPHSPERAAARKALHEHEDKSPGGYEYDPADPLAMVSSYGNQYDTLGQGSLRGGKFDGDWFVAEDGRTLRKVVTPDGRFYVDRKTLRPHEEAALQENTATTVPARGTAAGISGETTALDNPAPDIAATRANGVAEPARTEPAPQPQSARVQQSEKASQPTTKNEPAQKAESVPQVSPTENGVRLPKEAVARIREDSPEAKPIRDRIDELTAIAEARHDEMAIGQVRDLTHPTDLLTTAEKTEMHELKMRLRPKSSAEAKADIIARRKTRLNGNPEPTSPAESAQTPTKPQTEPVPAPPAGGFPSAKEAADILASHRTSAVEAARRAGAADPESAAQTAWAKLTVEASEGRVDLTANPGALFAEAARREAINEYRKASTQKAGGGTEKVSLNEKTEQGTPVEELVPDPAITPDRQAQISDATRIAEAEVAKLPEEHQQVIRLTSEGRTDAEIAASTGIPEKTVSTVRSQVRKRLQTAIRKAMDETVDSMRPNQSLYATHPIIGKLLSVITNGAKAAKAAFSAVKDIEKFDNFRGSLLNWSARSQKSYQEVMAAVDAIKSVARTPAEREGITNWIQANGDSTLLAARAAASPKMSLKRGYEAALKLTPEQIAKAKAIKATYDDLLLRGQSFGIVGPGVTDYVNQIWKRPTLSSFVTTSGKRLSEKFRFAKQRTYDSFFEGEQAGLEPRTKDIASLLPIYINEMNNAINSKMLVKELQKGVASDGRPLLAPSGSAKLVGGVKPGDEAVLVFPDTLPKDTMDYTPIDGNHPGLHDWKWTSLDSDGKPVLVKGDLAVHPEIRRHLENVLGQSAIRRWWNTPGDNIISELPKRAAKFLLDDAQAAAKETMLGFFSPFHQVQEGTHAVFHRVNPFTNIPKIDLMTDAAQMDAARHGLMLQPDRVSANKFMEGLGGGSKNIATHLAGKIPVAGPFIKNLADAYQQFLFHDYIPGLKYKTYEHILDRNMGRYKGEIAAGSVSEAQVKYLSAQQANAAYGHLNYTALGHDPTLRHIAQISLLAPDFLEARGRFTAQALKPGKVGREQLQAIAFGAGIFWLTARVINKIEDDDYHFDHPFEVIHGGRRYSMRSVPEDIFKAFNDSRMFISGRLSPVFGRGLVQGLSGVNYRGEKSDWSDTFKDVLASLIPITLQPFLRLGPSGKNQPVRRGEQLAGAFGIQIHRYSPVTETYRRAGEWMEKHAEENGITKDRGSYPVSKYQQLRYALEDGDADRAKEEANRLMTEMKISSGELQKRFKESVNHPFTGTQATDKKFRDSLNDRGKRQFEDAVKRRDEIIKRMSGLGI